MTFLSKNRSAMLTLLLLSAIILSCSPSHVAAADKFSFRMSPSVVDISPGIPAYFSMKVTSLSGFSDAVYFKLDLPEKFPPNPTYSFQPNNYVIPPANSFAYAYLILEIPSGVTTSGQYTLTIEASGGQQTVTQSVTVRVNFPAANFGISVATPSQTVVAGGSTEYQLELLQVGAKTGDVTLQSYDFPDEIQVNFIPPSVSPTGFAQLLLDTSSNLKAGTYYLAIGGQVGGLQHSATITLIVTSTQKPDFDLSIQPTTRYIAPGASTSYDIQIRSMGRFSSPVDLMLQWEKDVPQGVKASLSPGTVTPPADWYAGSTLSISAASNAQIGSFPMRIAGSSGAISDSVAAMLVITTESDFKIEVSPATKAIVPGDSARYQVTVTSIGQFSSDIGLDIYEKYSGISYKFDPATVKPSAGGSVKSTLDVMTSNDVRTDSYTLTTRGTSKTLVVSSTVTLVVTKTSDFLIAVTPTSQSVVLGQSTSFSIVISSLGAFSSEVTMRLSSVPAGVVPSFDPPTVKPAPGSPATSTLKLATTSDSKTGTYAPSIVGTSGVLTRSSPVSLVITAAPSYITISLSSSSVKQGDSIQVSGTVAPTVAGAQVTLTYSKPDGNGLTRTTTTGGDGGFSDSPPTDVVGTWQVIASWEGDQTHTGARSAPATFTVTQVPFWEQYGMIIGGIVVVIILAAAGLFFYSRGKKAAPPEAKRPRPPPAIPPSPPAPIVVEVPRPTPVYVEVPTPAPVYVEVPTPVPVAGPPPAGPRPTQRQAPPLILPRKRCFNCGDVISAQAKFCDKCRAPQPEKIEKKYEEPPMVIPRVYCVNCGEVISAQAKYCDKCDAPQE